MEKGDKLILMRSSVMRQKYEHGKTGVLYSRLQPCGCGRWLVITTEYSAASLSKTLFIT